MQECLPAANTGLKRTVTMEVQSLCVATQMEQPLNPSAVAPGSDGGGRVVAVAALGFVLMGSVLGAAMLLFALWGLH